MTILSNIIDTIVDINKNDFKIVKSKALHEKDITDTELPALLISSVKTEFSKQIDKTIIEKHEFSIIILVSETNTPLADLELKQNTVIKNILNSSILKGIVLKDSLEFVESNISNTVSVYSVGKAVHCVLRFSCEVGQEYYN